jgi:MFS family permease
MQNRSRDRPFFGWWVVFVSAIGMTTGIASVNLWSFGVFVKPLNAEFGWTVSEITTVLLIGTIVTVVSSPFIGRLVDRLGARRVALASITLLGSLLVSLYWLTPNLLHFYLVFGLMPLLGAGTSSVAYARVIARWFDRKRGLALGLTLAGVGVGAFAIPLLTNAVIQVQGWRAAYVVLGLLSLAVTLPLAIFLLRDSPESVGQRPDGAPPEPLAADGPRAGGPASPATPSTLIGYTTEAALRLPTLRLMVVAFVVLGLAIGGVIILLVPILEQRGVPRETAVLVQAGLGVALVLGRVFAGWLMDRFFAPYVAVAFLIGPIFGLLLFAYSTSPATAVIAALLIGLAAGAEVDVIAYMIGRYFGTRSYATLYGVLYSAWTLGSGFGPKLSAMVLDRTGSYSPALVGYAIGMAIACVLLLRLGPYPKLRAVSVTGT